MDIPRKDAAYAEPKVLNYHDNLCITSCVSSGQFVSHVIHCVI